MAEPRAPKFSGYGLQNTWGYNLGYFNNADNAVTASLAVSEVITHRSGCADFTVDHNTFRPFKPADKLQRGKCT